MRKLLYILLFIIPSSNIFAEFQYGFSIPVGLGITYQNTDIEYRAARAINKPVIIQDYLNVEVGALAQVGYNFNFSNTNSYMKGIGLFLDAGYYMYTIGSKHNYNDTTAQGVISTSYNEMFFLHSINIGLLPKLNFKNYSIGIGGGVRLPLCGDVDAYDIYSNLGDLPEEKSESLSYSDIKNTFKYAVAPYIKVTFQYLFPIKNKRFSPMLGYYFLYDFGMAFKTSELNDDLLRMSGAPYFKKYSYDAFTFGVLLGMYFW